MAVPCSWKTPSLPAKTSPETSRATRDTQGYEDYEDLLLLLTTKELFVLALQCNYRRCRKTAPAVDSITDEQNQCNYSCPKAASCTTTASLFLKEIHSVCFPFHTQFFASILPHSPLLKAGYPLEVATSELREHPTLPQGAAPQGKGAQQQCVPRAGSRRGGRDRSGDNQTRTPPVQPVSPLISAGAFLVCAGLLNLPFIALVSPPLASETECPLFSQGLQSDTCSPPLKSHPCSSGG